MSLNSDQLFVTREAHVLTAPFGTTQPDLTSFDPRNPSGAWSNFGHTSRTNVVKITTEGGAIKVLDTAAEMGAETFVEPTVRGFEFEALQIDDQTLQSAYNGGPAVNGWYPVPTQANPLKVAIIVYMVSTKGKVLARYGQGNIVIMSEPTVNFTDLAGLTLKATLLTDSNGNNMYVGGSQVTSASAATSTSSSTSTTTSTAPAA